jgi:hypothetical protein
LMGRSRPWPILPQHSSNASFGHSHQRWSR